MFFIDTDRKVRPMLSKKTYKNQITIPKKVEITPRKDIRLEKVRKKIADLGLSERDIENAVKWAKNKA